MRLFSGDDDTSTCGEDHFDGPMIKLFRDDPTYSIPNGHPDSPYKDDGDMKLFKDTWED